MPWQVPMACLITYSGKSYVGVDEAYRDAIGNILNGRWLRLTDNNYHYKSTLYRDGIRSMPMRKVA